MTMAVVAGVLLIVALRCWGTLPAMRGLWRRLVEQPAAWLNGLDRRHLLFALLLLTVLVAGGELLAMLGPLDMGLVLLWDVASFVDAAIAVTVVAGGTRLGHAVRFLSTRLGIARRRERRSRRTSGRAPANDDGEHPALRRAA